YDRHRQQGAVTLRRLGRAWRFRRIENHRMQRSKNSRGHARRIIGADPGHPTCLRAKRRDNAKLAAWRVIDEGRSARGAHGLAQLDEDGKDGLLEGDRAAEDFADRVEKVDFLVPLRKLPGRLSDFERRLKEM